MPRKSSPTVTIRCMGEVGIHAHDVIGSHATLCGMDGDDPNKFVQQEILSDNKTEIITCPQCIKIINAAKQYGAWQHKDKND